MKKFLGLVGAVVMISAGMGVSAGKFVVEPSLNADVSDHLEAEVKADDGHGEVDDGHGAKAVEPQLVKIGRVMIPVYKPRSITYVVADMGVSVLSEKDADFLKTEEGATKVRNYIIEQMMEIAETDALSGASIDTAYLSEVLTESIQKDFDKKIEDILFLHLMKTDMARKA